MWRTLILGLSLACGCATTTTTAVFMQDRNMQSDEGRMAARCTLAGGPRSRIRGYNPRNGVDELMSVGPTRVLWVHPLPVSQVITPEGLIYTCDRQL
jgi:hypothetical protein